MGILQQIDAVALTVVHLALAIGVTGHVLLHKRDIGASIGWIGLAWLSPILGSVIYLIFGINRVRRRASRLRERQADRPAGAPSPSSSGRDDHLAPLERAGLRITGRRCEHGNAIALLRNGDEAYPCMLAAIEAARASIGLSSYIFRADEAGAPFIDALTRAHRRGVAVRVLIDGIGGGYFVSETDRRLRAGGVAVARFLHSPLPWRMPLLNLRTHKKLLIVDGSTAFTGGLNIGGENLLRSHPPDPVRDTHFRFEGPVVAQLAEAFAEDWSFITGEELNGTAWFPPLAAHGDGIARAIVSGPDQDFEKIEFMILEAIACARRSIRIMTPYFLPEDQLLTALALAAMRGVEVDIILPERNNHLIMDWAVRAQLSPLIEAGCRIWRNPPPFEHSKIMTVDGIWGLIGSANWDMRSFRLNFELNMEVYHSDLVGEVDRQMAAMQHRPITAAELDRRPLPLRLRDNAARLMLPYL
ncbi:MAG: PLDc N-terminal domain-containing protein [Alphaproteobacteria bacterium]|nr:PLDc N-terminal domain-containing protein [Alphaproteobacteria bacterium]